MNTTSPILSPSHNVGGGTAPQSRIGWEHKAAGTTLLLDPQNYPGGIAVWGAMPPVLNTTANPNESGVHVHARKQPGKRKEIDETFDKVIVQIEEEGCLVHITVDGTVAQAFNIAEILNLPLASLQCPKCKALHFDQGWNAVLPHCQHLCESCGHLFASDTPSISNPLLKLRTRLQGGKTDSQPVFSARTWSHRLADWSEGIQIWGSNNAILWTADRAEESGIHIHAYNEPNGIGLRLADETFGQVTIDGLHLNPKQVRFLMAQLASYELSPFVEAIACPHCSKQQFDCWTPSMPSTVHVCSSCGGAFETEKPVISNPAKQQIEVLKASSGNNHG